MRYTPVNIPSPSPSRTLVLGPLLLALLLTALPSIGRAGLFEDEDARRAILDLRKQNQTLTQQLTANESALNDLKARIVALESSLVADREQNAQLRKVLLDLQGQLDTYKAESTTLRGSVELVQRDAGQLKRDMTDARKGQKSAEDLAQSVNPKILALEQRLAKLEPVQAQINGQDVWVAPDEKREFDAALAGFQAGDYVKSQKLFNDFLASRPRSAYASNAVLWLANTQYALRDFGAALQSYRSFVAREPGHPRAPEALLGVANCQLELKDLKGMRKSLEDLIRLYPQSDAAVASAGRLKALK